MLLTPRIQCTIYLRRLSSIKGLKFKIVPRPCGQYMKSEGVNAKGER